MEINHHTERKIEMATQCVHPHGRHQNDPVTGAVNPPISLATTYEQKSPGLPIGVFHKFYSRTLNILGLTIRHADTWNKPLQP